MVKDKPNINFQPGKRFSYCNTNYILLAMIIESITGKSYPDYMQQKFFQPLQMKNTYVFTLKDTLTATPSFNYNGNYWDYDFLDGTYGDKNIYTTPKDLLKSNRPYILISFLINHYWIPLLPPTVLKSHLFIITDLAGGFNCCRMARKLYITLANGTGLMLRLQD